MPTRRRLQVSLAGLAAALALLTGCTQSVTGSPQAAGPSGSSGPGSGSSSGSGGGSTASAAPSITAPTPAPAAFRDCTQQLEQAGVPIPSRLSGKISFGCAGLSVPLDYQHPDGTSITIALVRVHDSDNTHSQGSLLVNPGGPGASGFEFALEVFSQLPVSVLQNYDLIGFDPRGVGLSAPVHCLSNSQKDTMLAQSFDVTTPTGFAAAKRAAADVADACARQVGAGLPYYNTENTARDMDQIRQAVGDDRMNYLGFSYGTELGWVYAHLFPSRVRVMVLDGAVDPNASDIAQFAAQVKGFEGAFGQFAAHCRTVSPCSGLGDPTAAVARIAAAAKRSPLPTGTGRPLTEALAYTGITEALYSKSLWPQLGSALLSADRGDGRGLLQLADQYNQRSSSGQYTNLIDANEVISCNDSPPGPSDATVRATAAKWVSEFPVFGRNFAQGLFGCQAWQPDRTVPPPPRAATPQKVLVVGNLHDPATPYQGAVHLTADLGNAELLTWNGEGHTSYLQGSSCIDSKVTAYLVGQELPAEHTTCPR